MSLLEHYRKLLDQYDQVLTLSKLILRELRSQTEEGNLASLLEKKRSVGESITRLTQKISTARIENYSDPNLKTLIEVKGFLKQITEKAELIREVEEKIQNLLQKKG